MKIQVEISLYPLRIRHLSGVLKKFTDALAAEGLAPKIGGMSTLLQGESSAVFAAVARAFEICGASNSLMLLLKAGNDCPDGSATGECALNEK